MQRAISKLLLTGLLVTVALGGEPTRAMGADDSAQILERVLAAHRSARESIRTLKAQFKNEAIHPRQFELGSGTYLRSPEGVLVRSGKEGEAASDTLVKAGEARIVGRSWTKEQKVNYRAYRDTGTATRALGLNDIWQRLLLAHYGPNQQTLPFEQFVETATSPVRASSSREGGREIITVALSVGTGKDLRDHRYEFDGGVNYLIRKYINTMPGSEERGEVEIEEFLEAQPGVFVPIRNRTKVFKGSTIDQESLYSISNPVVNTPVPADWLKLPAIPSGTILKDRVHETEYPVDENWVRIGPAKPSPINMGGVPSSEPTEYTAQSTSEPRSTAQIIMMGSAGLLVAVGATWIALRWRRRVPSV